jgi:hypothetical protein
MSFTAKSELLCVASESVEKFVEEDLDDGDDLEACAAMSVEDIQRIIKENTIETTTIS